MNEGVCPIYPCHEEDILHEKLLDWKFYEDMEFFFDGYNLKSVFPGDGDGSLNNPYSGCCSCELVYLYDQSKRILFEFKQSSCRINIPNISKPSTNTPPKTGTFPIIDSINKF